LLAHTPSPTDEEINDAMNGNICRCGTYLRIRPAIHRAAVIAQNQLMKPAESARNLVGKI
jgi:aerobic-type carbon monoxide dehydrogenase small subunit (CoxS/CutS family)